MFQSQTVFDAIVSTVDPSYSPQDKDMIGVPKTLIQSMFEEKAFQVADIVVDVTILTAFANMCFEEMEEITDVKQRTRIFKSLQQPAQVRTLPRRYVTPKYIEFNATSPNLVALNSFLKNSASLPRLWVSGFSFIPKDDTVGHPGLQSERMGEDRFRSYINYIRDVLKTLINADTIEQVERTMVYRIFTEVPWFLWHSPDILEAESPLWLKYFQAYNEFKNEIIRLNNIEIKVTNNPASGSRVSVGISYTRKNLQDRKGLSAV